MFELYILQVFRLDDGGTGFVESTGLHRYGKGHICEGRHRATTKGKC